MRKEKDALGTVDIEDDTLWGIHTARALRNFRVSRRRVPYTLISALATVKQAAALTNGELGYIPPKTAEAIAEACAKICANEKDYAACFPLDALQGGAGTSTNMNVNEVVANLALKSLGLRPGAYADIHPLAHLNLHQSTNDVYPTALRIAAIVELRELCDELAKLQGAFQSKEMEFQDIVKMGRTEMQPAVPMTLGQEFSAFADAVARDRWRTFKCEERLRMINIGGTAVGTGLTAPRDYIFRVVEILRSLTGMGLARSENVVDGTANVDVFVEVSGILQAAAATLSKIAGDLRLLHFLGEIALPPLQAGSSIMPGKVNPVAAECVMQTSMVVRANDSMIGECASRGTLQINEFMPLIASSLLESIELLKASAGFLAGHVVGIAADASRCRAFVDESPSIMTALLPFVGYDRTLALRREFDAEKSAQPDLKLKDFLTSRLGEETVATALSETNLVGLGHSGKGTAS
ncbi:MAG: aspartate ammonia-lyase [Alphaproteobacteria bacterium]|nr:aspartate ammonia-lyase [Alphaproteobacteria bacterium]